MSSWLRKREKSSSKSETEWCTLGRDMLQEIIERLETRRDNILRLRAVCKGWRSSISFPPIISPNNALPFNLQFLPPSSNLGGKAHLLLKESTLYSLKPLMSTTSSSTTESWLLKIEESESGKVILKNPFPKMPIENFGKTKNNGVPKVINLLNYEVRELGIKEYSVDFVQDHMKSQPREEAIIQLTKVIVGHNKEGEFVVMAIHGTGTVEVWQMMGEDRWVVIDNGHCYEDIVFHKGRFYAVDIMVSIIAIDSSSLEITRIFRREGRPYGRSLFEYCLDTYLVKSGDDLYCLSNLDGCMCVFRLNEELRRWAIFRKRRIDRVMLEDGGFYHGDLFGGCKLDNCFYFRDSHYLASLTFPTIIIPTSK